MGQPNVVDAQVFGKRHRFAGELTGPGVEGLCHQRRLSDVEKVAWGCILDSGLTFEDRLLIAAVYIGDPDLRPVLTLVVYV
jgi:hypothetical protein